MMKLVLMMSLNKTSAPFAIEEFYCSPFISIIIITVLFITPWGGIDSSYNVLQHIASPINTHWTLVIVLYKQRVIETIRFSQLRILVAPRVNK